MQSLLWCFFGWRGQLTRQEFFLAILAVMLLTYVAGNLLTDLIGPTNNGETWLRSDLVAARSKARLISLVVSFWPSLAVQAKRLRHIGLPAYSMFVAQAVFLILLVLWPAAGATGPVLWIVFLCTAGGNLGRWADD